MSVGNDLEMHPSGRIEGPTLVVVDESSKCEEDEGCKEHVGGLDVANKKAMEGLV